MTTKLFLEEWEVNKIKEAEKITMVDYELQGNYIEANSLISLIEDLMLEISSLEDKISDLEDTIENDYELKHVDPYEEIGMSRSDFI